MPPRGLGVVLPDRSRKDIEHTRRRLEAEAFLTRRALRQQSKTSKGPLDDDSSNNLQNIELLQDHPGITPRQSVDFGHRELAGERPHGSHGDKSDTQTGVEGSSIPAGGNATTSELQAADPGGPSEPVPRQKSHITFAEEVTAASARPSRRNSDASQTPDLVLELAKLVAARAFHRYKSARLLRPGTLDYLGLDNDGLPISQEETLRDWSNLDWSGKKQLVHKTMVQHDSSWLAATISMFIMVTIVISSTTFCLETMDLFVDYADVFRYIESVSIIIFTVEYILKLVTAPQVLQFIPGPLNVVDLVAIVPWYIELLSGRASQGTSVLRVIRLARLLKIGGRYNKIQVVTKAMLSSIDVLGVLLFLIVILVVISSTLIYYCEHPPPADPNDVMTPQDFTSIPESFWWSMVTINTVGYGDVVPLTGWGKLVASLLMVVGLLVMALPISVIGTNFTAEWMDYKDMMAQQESMKQLPENVKKFESLLMEHATTVEYMISRYTETEAELDHLRMKLQDKITQNKNQMVDTRHRMDADGSDNDSDDGDGITSAHTGRNAGLRRLFVREKPGNVAERAHRELLEINSLAYRIQNRSSYLKDLLMATEILRGEHIEEDIRAVRMKYKQLEFIKEETLQLRSNVDGFEREVKAVDPQANFNAPASGRSLSTMDPLSSIKTSAAWQTLRRYASLVPSKSIRVVPSSPSGDSQQENEAAGTGSLSFMAVVARAAQAAASGHLSRGASRQASRQPSRQPSAVPSTESIDIGRQPHGPRSWLWRMGEGLLGGATWDLSWGWQLSSGGSSQSRAGSIELGTGAFHGKIFASDSNDKNSVLMAPQDFPLGGWGAPRCTALLGLRQ